MLTNFEERLKWTMITKTSWCFQRKKSGPSLKALARIPTLNATIGTDWLMPTAFLTTLLPSSKQQSTIIHSPTLLIYLFCHSVRSNAETANRRFQTGRTISTFKSTRLKSYQRKMSPPYGQPFMRHTDPKIKDAILMKLDGANGELNTFDILVDAAVMLREMERD